MSASGLPGLNLTIRQVCGCAPARPRGHRGLPGGCGQWRGRSPAVPGGGLDGAVGLG